MTADTSTEAINRIAKAVEAPMYNVAMGIRVRITEHDAAADLIRALAAERDTIKAERAEIIKEHRRSWGELRAENAALKAAKWDVQNIDATNDYVSACMERDKLMINVGVLAKALEFYSDPFDGDKAVPDFYIELNFGDTADAALANLPQPPEATE